MPVPVLARPGQGSGAVDAVLDVSELYGLTVLEPRHLALFKAAVEAGEQVGWAYNFPYLLAHAKRGRTIFLSEEEGSLCVFREDTTPREVRLDLVFPPIPMDPRALTLALERANDFNGDRSAKILRIDAKEADVLSRIRTLRVKQRRSQYVFAPARYETLSGHAFHTVRRNVKLFTQRPDVEVAPFAPSHADGCRALLSEWRERHRAEQGTGGGVGFTRRVLGLVGTLPDSDLGGETVMIDGRIVAFALGGMIRPGLGCSLERKCDASIRGLSYFHFRSFLWSLRAYERVNDGSDVRRAGVRQFKDSFRPTEMLAEFRASQTRSR